MLLGHVDLRVRQRAKATEFYDTFLNLLGAVKHESADATRIAFLAPTRGTIDAIAVFLPAIGARAIEMPHVAYEPNAYACFFEDPDGNKLEIVCLD